MCRSSFFFITWLGRDCDCFSRSDGSDSWPPPLTFLSSIVHGMHLGAKIIIPLGYGFVSI